MRKLRGHSTTARGVCQDGIYLACPECLTLSKEDEWSYLETKTEHVMFHLTSEGVEYNAGFEVALHAINLEHLVCETMFPLQPADIAVEIKDGAIVAAGWYWQEHPQRLEEIALKYGLTMQLRREQDETVLHSMPQMRSSGWYMESVR